MTGIQMMDIGETRPRDLPNVRLIPAVVLVVALTVVFGWLLGIGEVTSVIPGTAAMKFNTALIFGALAVALQLRLTENESSRTPRALADGVSGAALVLSVLTLVQFPLGVDLHVDQIFFTERILVPNQIPGRMNILTAIAFVLLAGTLLISRRRSRAATLFANVGTFVTALIAISVLFGYLYGVNYFFGRPLVAQMAIHTAALTFLLSIATTELFGSDSWLSVAWTRKGHTGRAVRTALPVAILALTAIGVMKVIAAEQRLMDLEIGLAVSSTFAAVTIVLVILWLAHRMMRQEQALHEIVAIARASEERFRLAAAATNDPIFEVDPRSGSIAWSDSITAMTGWTGVELSDEPSWLDKVHPDDRPLLENLTTSNPTTTKPDAVEYRIRRKDGEWLHVLSRRLVMRDRTGREPVRVIGSLTDISRQKELEARLTRINDELETRVADRTAELETAVDELRSEVERRRAVEAILVDRTKELEQVTTSLKASNRELEAFAYSVSHDLRAPLRSLDGFSRIVFEECGPQLDEQHRDYLQRIRAAAQRMGVLIDALLNLSRVTRAEMKIRHLDLTAIARDIVSELRVMHPDHHVDVNIEDELIAEGDIVLVRQALWNLLENAWKFTSNEENPLVELGSFEGSRERGFFVRDNGAGFDQTYADKLFTAFQRLHKTSEFPGTGIGLTTVQRIIHRHGGRVWAEGTPGQGAAFYFTLATETGS